LNFCRCFTSPPIPKRQGRQGREGGGGGGGGLFFLILDLTGAGQSSKTPSFLFLLVDFIVVFLILQQKFLLKLELLHFLQQHLFG